MISDSEIPPEIEAYFKWRRNEIVRATTFLAGVSVFLLMGGLELVLSSYLPGQGGWLHILMIGVAVLLGFPFILMERHAARLLRASAMILGSAAAVVLTAVATGQFPGYGSRGLPIGLLGADVLLWIGVVAGTRTSTWVAFTKWCKEPAPTFRARQG